MYSENQLDMLIRESISSAKDLPYLSQFATTQEGKRRIMFR
jgi:hypothetical protein